MEPWVRHLEARVKKLEAELREARKDGLASYSPKKITDRRTRLKYLLRQQQDMDHENDPSYGNADNAAVQFDSDTRTYDNCVSTINEHSDIESTFES